MVEGPTTHDSEYTEEERKRESRIQWEENRSMAVYDWEERSVSLAKLKANKYKYNKQVNMPRVQDPQTEAKHDIRKQMTRDVFREVEKNLKKERKVEYITAT